VINDETLRPTGQCPSLYARSTASELETNDAKELWTAEMRRRGSERHSREVEVHLFEFKVLLAWITVNALSHEALDRGEILEWGSRCASRVESVWDKDSPSMTGDQPFVIPANTDQS
jgi:hypothetical protein